MATDGTCRIDVDVFGDDGLRIGVLRGELDAATVGAVQASLAEVIRSHPDVVLDLEHLTFLGAAGVRLLLELRAACRDRGGELSVRNPQPLALRVFAITRTDDLLTRGRNVSVSTTEPAG